MVGIPDPQSRYGQYPHEFSGGMCQRIMIAMAISCNPKLLIADEATTALDVTTQAQILETLQQIVKKTNTALIIVTHNLGNRGKNMRIGFMLCTLDGSSNRDQRCRFLKSAPCIYCRIIKFCSQTG